MADLVKIIGPGGCVSYADSDDVARGLALGQFIRTELARAMDVELAAQERLDRINAALPSAVRSAP